MAANNNKDLTQFGPLPAPRPRYLREVPQDILDTTEYQTLAVEGLNRLIKPPHFFLFFNLLKDPAVNLWVFRMTIRDWWWWLEDAYNAKLGGSTGHAEAGIITLNVNCYKTYATDKKGRHIIDEVPPGSGNFYKRLVADDMAIRPNRYLAGRGQGMATHGFAHPLCGKGKLAELKARMDKDNGDARVARGEARVQDLSARGLLPPAGKLTIERK